MAGGRVLKIFFVYICAVTVLNDVGTEGLQLYIVGL